MMHSFKYEIVQLIDGVRGRPCLWDRTLESYKDRNERREAWEEVFRSLDGSYDDMSKEEKRITGELILNKWTNLRDSFIRSLKSRMGKPKKKYLYYEHLKFLKKVSLTQEESYEYSSQTETEETVAQHNFKAEIDSSEEVPFTKKRSRKSREDEKRVKYDKTEVDIEEVEVYNDPRVMNEDEAFFASLLPSVVNYSEDERLEFRIEVLAVMKRIKDKRTLY